MEARDNLLLAKTQQARHANAHRGNEIPYKVGDQVLLSPFHRRCSYMQRSDHRVAKFMVHFDGPYTITEAWPDTFTYLRFPCISASPLCRQRQRYVPFTCAYEPGPVVTEDGSREWFVDRILDRRPRGRGFQYLVRWVGYGPD